jgi:hypothetical protein
MAHVNTHTEQSYSVILSDRGAVFVETTLIAPILILFFLFCADFLAYTKSHTFVSQVARDSLIFFATVPGKPSEGIHSDLFRSDSSEVTSLCGTTEYETDPSCYHRAAQIRALRALNSDDLTLNMDILEIDTDYNSVDETVSIRIHTVKNVLFLFPNRPIEVNAVLRKVDLET